MKKAHELINGFSLMPFHISVNRILPSGVFDCGVVRHIVTVDFCVLPLSTIKSWIYVILPRKLAHFPFPDNDANLLSLQESLPDCKGNELGNINLFGWMKEFLGWINL
jgi:hypothetical protein